MLTTANLLPTKRAVRCPVAINSMRAGVLELACPNGLVIRATATPSE
jgi:hypothetical protein